jgi:outer membrane murein-binding lipoprotein Lpp
MDSAIICALISGAVTLIGSLTTWRITAKKDQDETRRMLKADIEDLKEDVTGINATIQQQIAVIDVKIETLSNRVEKHNNVIERTYKLEQAVTDILRDR